MTLLLVLGLHHCCRESNTKFKQTYHQCNISQYVCQISGREGVVVTHQYLRDMFKKGEGFGVWERLPNPHAVFWTIEIHLMLTLEFHLVGLNFFFHVILQILSFGNYFRFSLWGSLMGG